MGMSTSISSGWNMIAFSEETGVRGRRVNVVAKWPVWNLLRLRRRSPFDDLGSVGSVSKFYPCPSFFFFFVAKKGTYPPGHIVIHADCSRCQQP